MNNTSGNYPDFIYSPLVHEDINDDYFMEVVDALSLKVRRLKKKYSDFYKWLEAMDTYKEYMNKLAEKYCGKKVLMNSIEAGAITDYIPSRPKLKNKRKNKELLLMGIIPSKKMFKETDYDLPYDFGRNVTGDNVSETDSIEFGKIGKLAKKAIEDIEKENRIDNIFNSNGFGSAGRDFTYEYMKNLREGKYTELGKYKELGISDKMKQDEIEAMKEPWELELEDMHQFKYDHGRWIDARAKEYAEVVKIMKDEGFNVIGALNKNASRSTVKMLIKDAGITEPMTKKELKKFKKDSKKKRKQIEKFVDNNDKLEEILLNNKFKLSGDESINLDYTKLGKSRK